MLCLRNAKNYFQLFSTAPTLTLRLVVFLPMAFSAINYPESLIEKTNPLIFASEI